MLDLVIFQNLIAPELIERMTETKNSYLFKKLKTIFFLNKRVVQGLQILIF